MDNIARGLAERAYQDRELANFKTRFDADVKLVKVSLSRLERSLAYREATRSIWKEHAGKPKGFKEKRRTGTKHEPVWH